MPIQPAPEIKPPKDQVEAKPVKPKQPIAHRLQAVKTRVAASAAKIGGALKTVIFDAKHIDFTDEQSRTQGLLQQLDDLTRSTEASLGIIPEVAQEKPEGSTKTVPRSLVELAEGKVDKQEGGKKKDISHTWLILEARFLKGVKSKEDIEKFQGLVEYLEKTPLWEESNSERYPVGISEQEKEAIVKEWQGKGYSATMADFNDNGDSYLFLTKRTVPLTIERKHIPFLRDLVSSQNDPRLLLSSLREVGCVFNLDYVNMLSVQQSIAKFIQAPHAVDVLQTLQGISHLNETYSFEGRPDLRLDTLVSFAQNPNFASLYPKEIIERIDSLAEIIKHGFKLEKLEEYREFVRDSDRFELFLLLRREKLIDRNTSINIVFPALQALSEAGITEKLLTLSKGGVQLPTFGLFDVLSGTKVDKIANAVDFFNKPEIASFIEDPEKLAFGRDLAVTWGASFLPEHTEQIAELYDHKDRNLALMQLLAGKATSGHGITPKPLSFIKDINVVSEIADKLASSDFIDFYRKFETQTGYVINQSDFLSSQGFSHFVGIFEDQGLRDGLLLDSTGEVIKALHPSGRFPIHEANYYIQLGNIPNVIPAITALKGVGCELVDFYNIPAIRLQAMKDIANNPITLQRLASEEVKTLASQLTQEFQWEFKDNQITGLLALQDNEALRTKVFSESTQQLVRELKGQFDYAFKLEDAEFLVSAPSDLPHFINELQEQYSYQFNTEDIAYLVRLADNREGFRTVFPMLAEYGYTFHAIDVEYLLKLMPQAQELPQLLTSVNDLSEKYGYNNKFIKKYTYKHSDLPYLVNLQGFGSRLPEAMALLHEKFDYRFALHDTSPLLLVLKQNITAERLINLSEIHKKYKPYDGELTIDSLEFAVFAEQNQELIVELEQYNYKFSVYDHHEIEALATSENKERIIQVLRLFKDAEGQPVIAYNPTLTQDFERFLLIPNYEQKIQDLVNSEHRELLGSAKNLKIFVDIGANTEIFPAVVSIVSELNDKTREDVLQYIKKLQQESPEDFLQKITLYKDLCISISQSTSPELKKVQDQLIPLLMESQDPKGVLQRVTSVFDRNNLPPFAKKLKIFEIIYLTTQKNGHTYFEEIMAGKGKDLSPVLQSTTPERALGIIFADLLKTHIESGDNSLRIYLSVMQEGQNVLDKFQLEGKDALTTQERYRLIQYTNKLRLLHENSPLSRREKPVTAQAGDGSLEEKIGQLLKDFHVRSGQRISERVIEMFARPLGYKSIAEVLSHMDRSGQEAHARNLMNPNVQQGEVVVQVGDLLKGVEDDVLQYILQNGMISREYLGVNADSDATPFDIDTAMVLEEDLGGDLEKAINNSPSRQYGNIRILIRNRGQFVRTDQQETNDVRYDPNHYELFFSDVGLYGPRHHGIRTALPATEIDALVFDASFMSDNNNKLRREQIFFNIANNGFYIPVANEQGRVVFTERDFKNYRLNKEVIQSVLQSDTYTPQELIDTLKTSPFIQELYEMSAGVSEGYSTEQHTRMVLEQYEKYFAEERLAVLSQEEFRLMLALHDIGKPLAQVRTGSTSAQHEYTKKVLEFSLRATGISSYRVEVLTALVDQDILGEYFKGQVSSEDSAKLIEELAPVIGVPKEDLLDTLKAFYICDAGSYTADAGGVDSLGHLFTFEERGGKRVADFSEETQAKYQSLRSLVLEKAA